MQNPDNIKEKKGCKPFIGLKIHKIHPRFRCCFFSRKRERDDKHEKSEGTVNEYEYAKLRLGGVWVKSEFRVLHCVRNPVGLRLIPSNPSFIHPRLRLQTFN